MKKLIAFAVAASVLAASIFAEEEARNALLIANGEYTHFSGLSEPVKEAENLRAALEQIGFSVKVVKNASLEIMNDALADFEAVLKKSGGIGFLHYGGHAVQVAGSNYLIPSTAEIPDERRVRTHSLDVDDVMHSMVADTNIVVLDSCRNNPLPAGSGRSASRGLVISSVRPKNSIIVYSAEAGCTARDGVFTPALTKEITRKGVSLQAVLINVRKEVQRLTDGAQTPGEYSQMTDIVYLAGKSESEKPSILHSGSITVQSATGALAVSSCTAGDVYLDGVHLGAVRAFGTLMLNDIPAGMYKVEIRGENPFFQDVIIRENETTEVRFSPETEHVKAQAESGGIRFTIQRPDKKSYSAGFGTVIIYKHGKNGAELVRAVVVDGGAGSSRSKKELSCLFPLCERGEECRFLIQIEPLDGNTNKADVYCETLNIKAAGGSGTAFLPEAKGRAAASYSSGGTLSAFVEEAEPWKKVKRTVKLHFFAGNGDFTSSGEMLWFFTHEKKLAPGELFSFKSDSLRPKFMATGKQGFFFEFFYRFAVPGSSGISYFCVLQSRSNIAAKK